MIRHLNIFWITNRGNSAESVVKILTSLIFKLINKSLL